MRFLNNQDFYNTLSKNNKVLDSYSQLNLTKNNHEIYNVDNIENEEAKPASIDLFPSYLTPQFIKQKKTVVTKVSQKKIIGYAISIEENSGFEDFFKNAFSKSFRGNIKRFVNRFEACFNSDYKMFFGNINKSDYDFLMQELRNMLTKRFNQREESNKILNNWEHYLKSTFEKINSKKASLFVIYHDKTPVQISINYHFDKILFISIPSYNIDFAKFSLGNISIYKLLEWAVNNKYQIMDLEYGYLEYKRRWSNYIYHFDHHVIYQKNNFKSSILASFEVLMLKTKNILKSLKIDELVNKLKKRLSKQKTNIKDVHYKIESITFSNTKNIKPLDINSEHHSHLKKTIYDLLFANKEHITNVNVYEVNHLKEYVICGKNKSHKVIII